MNRAKLLRLSITLANSLSSTRQLGLRSLNSVQVTHFSQLTQSPLTVKPYICSSNPFNFHQNLFFSTKSESFINLVLSNDWSEEIEKELEKLCPNLTHESVLYDLVNLNENPQKSLDYFGWVCVKKGFCPNYTACFLLLKALACKGFMGEFWSLFSELEKNGVYFDFKAYFSIHTKLLAEKLNREDVEWTKRYNKMVEIGVEKELVELILSSDWGEEVKGVLKKKLNFPLQEGLLLGMILQLQSQPLKALQFFEWIGSCGGYEHDSVTYNTMAAVLARHDTVAEFWEFVKQMRNAGHEIDIITYTRSWRHMPIKDAVELFVLMMDGPYQPSLQNIHSLMMHISRDPDLDVALALSNTVFDKVVSVGITPNKSLYDGVHKVLCLLGRLDEAKKTVEVMRNAGYEPDNITYSHEVSGLCKIRRFEEACKVLEQMEAKGCVPNVKNWTALIKDLCSAGQLDMALSCFSKMKEKNTPPSALTLSILLQGFMSENKVLDAYRIFIETVKKDGDLKPLQSSYNLMFEKLLEAEKLEEAFQILDLMRKQNIRASPHPMTQYISKFGTLDDAKRYLNLIASKTSSSTASYDKVITAFFEQGRHSEAKALVYESPPKVRTGKVIIELFGHLPPPIVSPHFFNDQAVHEMPGSVCAPPVEKVWKKWDWQSVQP